ncbi:MAG: OmpA family protein [FCB group bacterium]|jgi:outer membrane protein OmpA-like peptidoglycan-associated protein
MKKLFILSAIILLCLAINYSQTNAQLINTVVSITGSVIDQVTHQPMSTTLEVFDDAGAKVTKVKSNAKDGYYFITGLKPGKTYTVRNLVDFDKGTRYFNEKIEFNIPNTDKYAEFSRDILLVPLEKELAVPMRVNPFFPNKSKLRPGSEFHLRHNINRMVENPRVKFEISCFPDNSLNEQANLKLTEERSQALKDYYVSKGIADSRITIKGNSKTDPNNPPPTAKAAKGKKYKGPIYIVIKSY